MRRIGFFRKIFIGLFFIASVAYLVHILWITHEGLERRKRMIDGPSRSSNMQTEQKAKGVSGAPVSDSGSAASRKATSLQATQAAQVAVLTKEVSLTTASGVHEFKAIVANTPASRQQGLSGKAGLGDSEGMLFIFDTDEKHGFWMKDMLFSIDMIWFDESGRVVHIESNVSPDTFPKAFAPSANARYVLELNAGTAAKIGLKVGDDAKL